MVQSILSIQSFSLVIFILLENAKYTTKTEISHVSDKLKFIKGNRMKYRIYNSHFTLQIKIIKGYTYMHARLHILISIYKHAKAENSTKQEHGQPNG